jgi:hypothetical protein
MNIRVTLGFLLVAVILGAVVIGLDKFNIGPTPAANATSTAVAGQDQQIYTFDDAKVTAFELRQGDKSVRLEKKEDAWTVAGTGEPGNRTSINSLLVRMSQLRASRRVDNPGDLAPFGLDPAKDAAVAEMGDGTKYELLIGGKTPVLTGTYAKKSDAPDLFVIADQFVADLERLITDPKEPPTPTPRPATPTPDPALAVTTPTPAP